MYDQVIHALTAFWSRTLDAFRDPVRRWHVLTQICLVGGPAWAYSGTFLRAAGIVATYYALYEFLVEPLSKWLVSKGYWCSLVGPYWEGGPADGETFERP